VERTFIMVKPNGVARGLVGEIVTRFERRGFVLRGMKALRLDRTMAERHYAEHIGRSFFEPLVAFITSGPVVAMVWEGGKPSPWRGP
jgi:nucleoside-diphosphate kinase